jgi:hypothetical protein
MSNPNFHTHPLPLGHCRAQQSELYDTPAATRDAPARTQGVVETVVGEEAEEAQEKAMSGDDEVARWKVGGEDGVDEQVGTKG